MDEELLLAAKLRALAEFAAGAGHEINNPLAAISGRVQLLLRDEIDPERRRHLLTIGAQALRIRDMIGDVMLFARPPLPVPQEVDLRQALAVVGERFADDLLQKQLTFEVHCDGRPIVRADRSQLEIVISELLRNAIRFSPDAQAIAVTVGPSASEFIEFSVSDSGPGLTEIEREHLFDPFFSGRQAGRGLGFGLTKCWRIVTLHGGDIFVDDAHTDGLSLCVRWPRAVPIAQASPEESSVADALSRR